MATLGHGPSKSTCDKCYRVTVEPSNEDASRKVTISIYGPKAYQGFLLQVKNEKNETVGQFVDYDEKVYAPVACDDEAGDEDDGVLGHTDARLKYWPTRVGWTIPSTETFSSLRVQGMIVMDLENYHLLPETPVKIHHQPAHVSNLPASVSSSSSLPSASKITASTSITTTSTVTIIPFTDEEEDPNQLFFYVLGIILGMYFVMAMAQYQLQRRKRVYKQEAEQNALTKDW
ncbi:hypothetical protein EC973_000752 [Apophysomyces ossiformis]|uniref:Reelin domain-containing protein n=1 Tax=Apophysomyces ossiformis TaxID=679940 RepID=A0A8H7BLB4_9FUNG|nr:hypothetical protein EC973_000752 [Apophysomyces ossiformis]